MADPTSPLAPWLAVMRATIRWGRDKGVPDPYILSHLRLDWDARVEEVLRHIRIRMENRHG